MYEYLVYSTLTIEILLLKSAAIILSYKDLFYYSYPFNSVQDISEGTDLKENVVKYNLKVLGT